MNGSEDNSSHTNVLEQNCRPNWPKWTCIVGNVCGLCSTTLWFLVLLPQVWKNFRRKSVKGLSVLWATANFTASLINLFFVFMYASIPLYGQISSIYCPILEFTLLIQFWIYGPYRKKDKFLYVAVCTLLWGAVITVELILKVQSIVEYAAIFLWCIETFPQVIMNMALRTTSGQSTSSVFIAMIGKTTDFLSTNGLVMPLQYVIMAYFSSSVAFINGLQVAWYSGNGDTLLSYCRTGLHKAKDLDHTFPVVSTASFYQANITDMNHSSKTNLTSCNSDSQTLPKVLLIARWFFLIVLCLLLIGCVIGFVWNIHSFYGLFAPVSIFVILIAAKVYLIKFGKSSHFHLR